MIAAPDTVDRTGQRHRVVTIGSGYGGLTATKALKHAEVNITDGLVFLTRVAAQGASHVVDRAPLWLQVIPAPAGLAATIGVLIALRVALHRAERQPCCGSRSKSCAMAMATVASPWQATVPHCLRHYNRQGFRMARS